MRAVIPLARILGDRRMATPQQRAPGTRGKGTRESSLNIPSLQGEGFLCPRSVGPKVRPQETHIGSVFRKRSGSAVFRRSAHVRLRGVETKHFPPQGKSPEWRTVCTSLREPWSQSWITVVVLGSATWNPGHKKIMEVALGSVSRRSAFRASVVALHILFPNRCRASARRERAESMAPAPKLERPTC